MRTLRVIEEWTGHRKPRRTMKLKITFIWLALIGWLVLAFASCATTETKTTVTAPDGTVTVTESKITAPDSASVTALGNTAVLFSPRAVVVTPTK